MDSSYVTLTANVVSTITLDGDYRSIEVVNVSGSAAVYFNVDSASSPAVAGNDCWRLPAAASAREIESRASGATVIKLISVGTPTVGVIGIS